MTEKYTDEQIEKAVDNLIDGWDMLVLSTLFNPMREGGHSLKNMGVLEVRKRKVIHNDFKM